MEAMNAVLEGTPEPIVLDMVWAEGEDLGGGEGGEGLDLGEGGEGEELELGDGAEGEEGAGGGEGEGEKVDGRRGSKEFREALKAWEATPEGAKFAKTARADHFRVQELATIEPGGVTALREKYALLEAVGGAEGVTTLQERVAEVEATDALFLSGDPKGLDALGPDFDPGLAKLAPAILERVMRANPEAYSAAILPHLMTALGGSALTGGLNSMIDVLQAPHLDEKGKLAAITKLLGGIGQWYKTNEERAGQLKTAPVDKGRQDLQNERSEFEKQQQEAHWKTNVVPQVAQAERGKFEQMLKPFAAKLGLTPAEKDAALRDFRAKITAACNSDKEYLRQLKVYRAQKNPNPAAIVNFAKAHLAKKAQAAFDAMKGERWGSRLKGGTGKPAAKVVPGARTGAGTGGGAVTVVSVKPTPDEIDYRKTSEADQWKGKYTLKTGKVVQYRKPAA